VNSTKNKPEFGSENNCFLFEERTVSQERKDTNPEKEKKLGLGG
jgi:hypothetical protein